MAYATTAIDGSTADLAAPKPEQEVDIKSFKVWISNWFINRAIVDCQLDFFKL